MIISPTSDNLSSLSPAADYRVEIKDQPINLQASKSISTASTISGGAAISVWESSVEGLQIAFTATVKRSEYDRLLRIKNSGLDEWLWRIDGRIFEIVFDMPSAVKQDAYGLNWIVRLSFVVIKEV